MSSPTGFSGFELRTGFLASRDTEIPRYRVLFDVRSRVWPPSGLNQPPLQKRNVSAVFDHDVIDDVDADQLADGAQARGDLVILRTGLGIAPRMVVYEHDTGRRSLIAGMSTSRG